MTQPHRGIPFHLRKKLDIELDKLERQGTIEPVDGPTPWVSPLVVTPKPKNPDEIRLCIDRRQPNRAIFRERHITPTIDDLIHDLNGAIVVSLPRCCFQRGLRSRKFSQIDAKPFHQCRNSLSTKLS